MSEVEWGLFDPSKGYDYQDATRNLAQIGLAQAQTASTQQNTQANAYKLRVQQRQDEVRPLIAKAVGQGDYSGAQQQALGTGDTDMVQTVGQLQDHHLQQIDREAEAMGSTAYSLKQLPAEQRAAAFQAAKPYLMQQGFSPEELSAADLSDNGLQGYITHAVGVKGAVQQAQATREANQSDRRLDIAQAGQNLDEQRFEFERHKPEAFQFGTTAIDPTTHQVVYDGSGAGGTGGGTPGASVPYTGGWTPRQRNGGDNPDAAVDNKIAMASRVLGVDPTADLSKMDPRQIAVAMTQGEGGTGSLADRNNNPANLRNPDGSYKKFATREAGLAAAAALVQRKLANGQTTVQTLIEGVPAKGAAPAGGGGGAGGMSAAAIDLAAREGLAHGGVVPSGYARNRAAQAAITNRMAELAGGKDIGSIVQGGQTTKSQGDAFTKWNSGRQGTGAAQVRSLGVAVEHLDQLGQAAQALGNGNTQLFNRLSQAYAQQTGSAAPTNFNAIKDFVGDEVVKAVVGSGGGVGDRDKAQHILASWNSPSQTAGVIHSLQGLMGSQLHGLGQQYQQTTGRQDFDRYVTPRARQVLGQGGGGNVPTLTPEQARAAPKGTRFRTVDGRVMVRQ